MNHLIRIAILCSALVAPLAVSAAAQQTPAGPVVLSVDAPGDGTSLAQFDIDMLEALPQVETRTKSPWYSDVTRFTGPLLTTVLDAAEAQGNSIRVFAVNDYSATIPVDEIRKYPVILATRIEGKRISLRDKGPLFVIYPFSQAPELYNELTFNKSVWQVVRIEVE